MDSQEINSIIKNTLNKASTYHSLHGKTFKTPKAAGQALSGIGAKYTNSKIQPAGKMNVYTHPSLGTFTTTTSKKGSKVYHWPMSPKVSKEIDELSTIGSQQKSPDYGYGSAVSPETKETDPELLPKKINELVHRGSQILPRERTVGVKPNAFHGIENKFDNKSKRINEVKKVNNPLYQKEFGGVGDVSTPTFGGGGGQKLNARRLFEPTRKEDIIPKKENAEVRSRIITDISKRNSKEIEKDIDDIRSEAKPYKPKSTLQEKLLGSVQAFLEKLELKQLVPKRVLIHPKDGSQPFYRTIMVHPESIGYQVAAQDITQEIKNNEEKINFIIGNAHRFRTLAPTQRELFNQNLIDADKSIGALGRRMYKEIKEQKAKQGIPLYTHEDPTNPINRARMHLKGAIQAIKENQPTQVEVHLDKFKSDYQEALSKYQEHSRQKIIKSLNNFIKKYE